MKKNIYAIILLTVGAFFTANAQSSMQLTDTTGGNLTVAQPSYTITVDSGGASGFLFYVKNVTSSPINIQLKSYVYLCSVNDALSYCIGTQCHNAGTPVTVNTSIPANGTLTNNGLLADFVDFDGQSAKVKYTLFNPLNSSDSNSVVITYNIVSATTGIKQNVNNYNVSNIAPNPASSNVSLSYDLKSNNQPATVKIYNMLGTLVKTTPLETYSTNTKIDITSLEEGMYFYSVTVGSKVVKTNRLVVAR